MSPTEEVAKAVVLGYCGWLGAHDYGMLCDEELDELRQRLTVAIQAAYTAGALAMRGRCVATVEQALAQHDVNGTGMGCTPDHPGGCEAALAEALQTLDPAG